MYKIGLVFSGFNLIALIANSGPMVASEYSGSVDCCVDLILLPFSTARPRQQACFPSTRREQKGRE